MNTYKTLFIHWLKKAVAVILALNYLSGCSGNLKEMGTEFDAPNILIIMPDQWRGFDLGCMGNKDVLTPNIDRLAAKGLLVKNTFANTPVCCPARANLLTGKFAHSNGMTANDLRLREQEITIAEILKENGYRTGFIGKWHLDGGARQPGYIPPGPRRQGFDFWAANECSHSHFNTEYFRNEPQPIPIDTFEAVTWFDQAIDFINNDSDQPFFLMIAPGPPHNPYKAPDAYSQLYDPEKLTMRKNWQPGVKRGSKEEIAEYYGMMTAVDDQVGKLLNALEVNNLEENTVVLFTSDHGDMLGSQGHFFKRKPWEESIRIPGIIKYPSKIKPGETEALFSHVDMAPTLLSFAGVTASKEIQGQDLSSVFTGEIKKGPASVYFEIMGPYEAGNIKDAWRGVRTQQYMYATFENEPWILYDVSSDPFELKNLAQIDESANLREQFDDEINRWMEKTNDAWSLNWKILAEDKGKLYKAGDPVFYSVEEYIEYRDK